ncbi:MAG: prephenate dehydrogenase/arogenate dehydrogenase family protein [Coriobacteriales bacterium]|jgi:prephenate dehydrogenase
MVDEDNNSFKTVLIVGLGLIGGSIAIALRSLGNGIRVYGVDADPETVETAKSNGIVDDARLSEDGAIGEFLSTGEVDLVVLAMPPRFAEESLVQIERSGYRGAITDTASTKGQICEVAERVLSDSTRFIPGHPMSGREVSGLGGAVPGLFTGKYWILCPNESTQGAMFLALHSLITSIGAKCITVPREQHDDMVAVVSHVPHMAASALVKLVDEHARGEQELFRLAAGGFKDSTRIAASSPSLWVDIVMSNKDAISSGVDELRQILGDLQQMIENNDSAALLAFLESTSRVRRRIPSSWIPKSEKLLSLRVPMENRPGTIATVTAIAGRFGCNIQSIGIDHITDETAILDLTLTDEGDISSMMSELAEEGFDVPSGPLEVES